MALEEDWRQDAQEMLDEGKVDAALFVMEDTSNRINEVAEPIEQVNTLRYLGELYQQANKPNIAAEKFTEAMRRSLLLEPEWKAFSAVISVLEMHRDAVENHKGLSALLQTTLDNRLLTKAAGSVQSKEMGRFIKTFDGVGTQRQVLALLRELREINQQELRKHALFALTKIKIKSDSLFRNEPKPTPHFDADAYERFLWQYLMATMHKGAGASAQYREYVESAKKLTEEVPTAQRSQVKKMLRKLR